MGEGCWAGCRDTCSVGMPGRGMGGFRLPPWWHRAQESGPVGCYLPWVPTCLAWALPAYMKGAGAKIRQAPLYSHGSFWEQAGGFGPLGAAWHPRLLGIQGRAHLKRSAATLGSCHSPLGACAHVRALGLSRPPLSWELILFLLCWSFPTDFEGLCQRTVALYLQFCLVAVRLPWDRVAEH